MTIISQNKEVELKFEDTNFNINSFVEMYGNRYMKYKIEGADYNSTLIHELGRYKTKKRTNEIYKEILRFINIKDRDYIYQMPEK